MSTMHANDRPVIDHTNKDYASLRQAMLDLAREKLPEWSDHSPNDLGVLLVELFAYMGDILLYYQDRIANESYLDTAVERRSVINLLRLIGYELRPPQPASANLTLLFSQPDPKEESAWWVQIPKYSLFKTAPEVTGEEICFHYIRDTLDINLHELQPQDDGGAEEEAEPKPLVFAYLPVVQVDQIVADETVGSSDGTSNQRFRLADKPLLEGTLVVRVDGTAWQEQPSLLHSLSLDGHFIVRRDEEDHAWIEFGDGKYGQIPPRGRNNITAAYLVGGGVKGNVPARAITEHGSDIDLLLKVFNEQAATGGMEHESLTVAARRGPSVSRAMQRAVTARDYEAHAMRFGVAKVRAREGGWNRIKLYAAPAGGGYLSDTTKEDLRKHLEDKRVITASVEICDPDYVPLHVEGTLIIEPYYFVEQVQQAVSEAIGKLFSFENLDFQAVIYLSKVYEAIEAVEGVAWVFVTALRRADAPADQPLPDKGKLEFGWNEIPRVDRISWRQAKEEWRWGTLD